jgi:hypothetical protein
MIRVMSRRSGTGMTHSSCAGFSDFENEGHLIFGLALAHSAGYPADDSKILSTRSTGEGRNPFRNSLKSLGLNDRGRLAEAGGLSLLIGREEGAVGFYSAIGHHWRCTESSGGIA